MNGTGKSSYEYLQQQLLYTVGKLYTVLDV